MMTDARKTIPLPVLALFLSLGAMFSVPTQTAEASQIMTSTQATAETLSRQQQAIPLIAALMATSDMPNLNAALNQGLDAGLTISETREILVQLYAYVGFPRSLNALNELMTVVQARKQRGIDDAPGREPSRAIATGDVRLIHLPQIGINGNTHFPMSDLNNVQIADLVSSFLKEKHLD
jgi:alkylhydroperoxidase/carboxymuconolactone decarboxylase family protein YurZ